MYINFAHRIFNITKVKVIKVQSQSCPKTPSYSLCTLHMHQMLHYAVGNAHVETDGSTVGM
jgi:hypothetical protein